MANLEVRVEKRGTRAGGAAAAEGVGGVEGAGGAAFSGPIVARVMGDVGMTNVDRLVAKLPPLLEDKPCLIVLDLSETTGVTSMALGALVQFHKNARQAGIRVRIAAPSPTALTAILLARLDTVFDVYATLDDALAGEEGAYDGPLRVGQPRPPTGVWNTPTSGDWPISGASSS